MGYSYTIYYGGSISENDITLVIFTMSGRCGARTQEVRCCWTLVVEDAAEMFKREN